MKRIIAIICTFIISVNLFSQNKEEAEKLVEEGVAYHDKGDFEGAIAKYDKALELDKNNLVALAEKAFSLLSTNKYDEAVTYCQKAIELHPSDKGLKTVYVTYGNSLDALKKTDKSIEVYDQGIKQFPEYYQLYFNKGVTLSSIKKYDEALLCFQKSIQFNPKHPGSLNAMGTILYYQEKNIPSLLAMCRFLVVEPQSNRAKNNLAIVQKIVKGNVEKTGKKSVTVYVDPKTLSDGKGEKKENDFSSTDLLLQLDASLDFDKKNKKKSDAEQFIRKITNVCASMSELKKDNTGFYWEFFAPYFIEMKNKDLIETFGYLAFASSEDEEVAKWLKSNKSQIDKFYDWSKVYAWKTN